MKRILPMVAAALIGVGGYFLFVHNSNDGAPQLAAATTTTSTASTEVADNADDGEVEVRALRLEQQDNQAKKTTR